MASIEHTHNLNLCEKHECAQLSEKHDSYFCPRCEEWIEDKCDDSDCEFCSNRPDKAPGMVVMRFNNGRGAITCSKCSIIIKEGYEFTDLENEFLEGIISYLPEYFCEECNDK